MFVGPIYIYINTHMHIYIYIYLFNNVESYRLELSYVALVVWEEWGGMKLCEYILADLEQADIDWGWLQRVARRH